jgi:hypothetical protein
MMEMPLSLLKACLIKIAFRDYENTASKVSNEGPVPVACARADND